MGFSRRTLCLLACTGVSQLGACTIIDREVPADAQFSPGCGAAPLGPGPFRRDIVVDGTTRSYTLRVPGSYDPDFPYPLVVLLHGAGGDGDEIRDYADFERSSRASAIYAYPDAAANPEGLTAWDPRLEGQDLPFIDRLRSDLAESLCVDEARVFVVGFSSGASMAHAYACYSGRTRGFAAVAGGYPIGACAAPAAAWIAHDENDPIVDVSAGARARDLWASTNGCDLEGPMELPGPCVEYSCEDAPLRWCTEASPVNLAHQWPNWASDEIWAFFSAL